MASVLTLQAGPEAGPLGTKVAYYKLAMDTQYATGGEGTSTAISAHFDGVYGMDVLGLMAKQAMKWRFGLTGTFSATGGPNNLGYLTTSNCKVVAYRGCSTTSECIEVASSTSLASASAIIVCITGF